MATESKSMQAISMEYLLRLPQTIWATDDTTDMKKYTTGDDLELELLREIFAKIRVFSIIVGLFSLFGSCAAF
jgi:hypothetical protein